MTEIIILKLVFAAVTFLVCFGGGLLPSKIPQEGNWVCFANCFSAGVLLGAALIHLLADATEKWEEIHKDNPTYPWHLFSVGLGVIVCLAISGLGPPHSHGHSHSHHDHDDHSETEEEESLIKPNPHHHDETTPTPVGRLSVPYLLALSMSFECFFTGVALGISETVIECIVVFVAIITHVWAEAFVLVTSARKANFDQVQSYRLLAVFCMASPMGVIIGMFATAAGVSSTATATALYCFCSGLFLYVSLVELLPEEMSTPGPSHMKKVAMLASGFLFMAIVAVADSAQHN